MSVRTGSHIGIWRRLILFGLTAVVLAAGRISATDVSIAAALSPDTVGVEEQSVLEVTVSGADQNFPQLQMPTLSTVEVYSQGQASNINIVNGAVSASITYRFLLIPRKPGTINLQGIFVMKDGKRFDADPIRLTVLDKPKSASPRSEPRAADGQGNSRDYFLEAVVDKKTPFVNEQVTLTLKFFIGVQYYSSPELDEPATTGFWTEVLGNSSPYFQKVGGRNYRVIERKYALFPTQTGELTIGRAAISTTVAARAQRRDPFDMFGDMFAQGQKITTASQPITIQVRPLPQEGQPADFSGSVGKFDISVLADKTQVEVNQPVTVKVKIAGAGNIKSIAEPKIPDLQDFRVYRASSNESSAKINDRLSGTKVYEEVFMPKRPGILEIPALAFNYFDPDRGRYETLMTKPISISVAKPEGYLSSPDIPYSSPAAIIGSQAQDIRYIKSDAGDLRPIGKLVILTPAYLLANGLPVAVLVGLVVMRRRRDRLSADIGYARSRSASRGARKRLGKARSLAKLETAQEFYGELSLVVTAYVADKLNVSPHGLMSDKIGELLADMEATSDLINDVTRFLRQCDFARFAPTSMSASDLESALSSAESIMVRMEEVKFG